jgi:hypothetical protein
MDEPHIYKDKVFTDAEILTEYLNTGGNAPHWRQTVNGRDEN